MTASPGTLAAPTNAVSSTRFEEATHGIVREVTEASGVPGQEVAHKEANDPVAGPDPDGIQRSGPGISVLAVEVGSWVRDKYLQQVESTERLAKKTNNKLETVAAFGLSKLDACLMMVMKHSCASRCATSKPFQLTGKMNPGSL